jgi:hypothetical protein
MAFRFAWLVAVMTSCSSASPIEPALNEEADELLPETDTCPDETSPGCPPPDFDSR